MAKLKENVFVRDPETGRATFYRVGEELDPKLVSNPNLFEDEPERASAPSPTAATPPPGAQMVPDREPREATLEDHTVDELHELADRENIDLQGARLKDDIVARIREARE